MVSERREKLSEDVQRTLIRRETMLVNEVRSNEGARSSESSFAVNGDGSCEARTARNQRRASGEQKSERAHLLR